MLNTLETFLATAVTEPSSVKSIIGGSNLIQQLTGVGLSRRELKPGEVRPIPIRRVNGLPRKSEQRPSGQDRINEDHRSAQELLAGFAA